MAGLVAYLVHGLVDFDWYAYGFSETLMVVAAVAVAAGTKPLSVNLPASVAYGFGGILLVFAGYILAFLTPNLLAADGSAMRARDALRSALSTPNSAERNNAFEAAETLIDEAEVKSPKSAEIPLLKSQIFFEHWRWTTATAVDAKPNDAIDEKGDIAHMAALRAIELRPDDPSAYFLDGQICYGLGEYNGTLAVTGENITDKWRAGKAKSFFDLAHKQFGLALKRYPTSPRYNFWYARSLFALGNNPGRALLHYQEAERLSDLVRNLPRLKLSDDELLEIHTRVAALQKAPSR